MNRTMIEGCGPWALVLAAWATYWEIARPPAATLPSILAVAQVVTEIAGDGRLGDNVLASLWRLLLGTLLGALTGRLLRELLRCGAKLGPKTASMTASSTLA